LGKNIEGFNPDVIQLFLEYQWPGNLRELKNIVKRATLLETSNVIQLTALPFEMIDQFPFRGKQLLGEDHKAPHLLTFILPESQFQHDQVDKEKEYVTNNSYVLKKASIGAEYEMILEAIKLVNNNKSKAALLLNIDRKTLYNKMKQYKEYSITKAASKK
jgi:two-component system, NtrC family, response regulator HydG